MAENQTILNELKELNSSLAADYKETPYRVPANYFNNLPDQLVRRIKALELVDSVEELKVLSPSLSAIGRSNPYQVAAGYFENNLSVVLDAAKLGDLSADEELAGLSPLLSGLRKENPYAVPVEFFETLKVPEVQSSRPAKVIGMVSRKWFRYAAAAVMIGFVVLIGLRLADNNPAIDPTDKPGEWVAKSLNKVSTDAIDSFVTTVEESAPVIASIDVKNEISDLIKDVSEKDIQSFLDDAETDATDPGDELLN